ncbi:AAA family ATPase, partial [Evtepia sp.]
GVAPYYESFHHVKITPDIARLAVLMSERYITDRFLPDKAIDLIDEACSDANLRDKNLARSLEVEKELKDIAVEREVMVADASDRAYERLAELRSKELQLLQEQKELSQREAPTLTLDSLARVVELWTKIPASTIQEQEYERLAKLEERLKAHVIGQDEAIAAVAAAIRRNRVGVTTKRKPVSFIFVGSTGVGKTELVKRLAEDLFHAPESLIRLDMSEFMEKHSVSRIIGSPPGYVGYDEAGQLTEKIRRKPYSVILFDEIEKAHPDVLNILLQILDDGHITDAQGRTVNFENTVIVMTSNAGSDSSSGPLGFGKTANELNKDKAMKALQQFLRPEFINRVDEVICFNQLSEENFRAIALIMFQELQEVLAAKHITFVWQDPVLDLVVKESYSAAYGARNLRRYIQKHLEDPIASKIIESYLHPITGLGAVVEDGKIALRVLQSE